MRNVLILEAKAVQSDSRLRLEKKFKVGISTKESRDLMTVTTRDVVQYARAQNQKFSPTAGLH